MLGVSQTSEKCTFNFNPFLPDFCLFVLFSSTCLRKAKCVGGCGQKHAVPASNCSSTASFSGLVSLSLGISKFLLHHRSTEEDQVTLTHFLGSGRV